MQHYELMYIVDSAADEGLDEVRQKIEGIITGREGVVLSYDKLGKKRLAYSIAKRQYGTYFLVNFKGNGKIVSALEYYLRLSPVVIRHILLVFSEKTLGLRERTAVVQLEEAERMRAGGRPAGSKPEEGESAEVVAPVAAAVVAVTAPEPEPVVEAEVEPEPVVEEPAPEAPVEESMKNDDEEV